MSVRQDECEDMGKSIKYSETRVMLGQGRNVYSIVCVQ